MPRRQFGFTLIELLIVMVIIGILAAIAIPNFIAMQNKAKEGETKSTMHALQLAVEDYGVANGKYPDDVSEIVQFLPGNEKLMNRFTKQRTEPSNWGTPGSIIYTGDSTGYTIRGIGVRDTLSLVLTNGR